MKGFSEKEDLDLASDMGLDEPEVQRRLAFFGWTEEDKPRVLALRGVVQGNLESFSWAFFDYLGSVEGGAQALSNPALGVEIRKLKKEHLQAMAEGNYGMAYALQRLKLGLLYARAGIDPRTFLGAFHHLMRSIGLKVMQESQPIDRMAAFENFMSLKKVAFFDISLIVDVIIFERERVIRQQQQAIRELSTPVLLLKDRLLVLPLVGVFDTERARQMTEALLAAVREQRAQAVVIDITGVPVVDSRVAKHLADTIAAAGLMGAATVVTGLSAEVAQALVSLGLDAELFNTAADLQRGLEWAERQLGYAAAAAI